MKPYAQSIHTLDDTRFTSVPRMLALAAPLILSQFGVMLMKVVDSIYLSRYSETAIAAVGPAGMTFMLLCSLFFGMVGYSNTFVAQFIGAKQEHRVGAAVWQGLFLALCGGLILAASTLAAKPFFDLVGHDPAIREQEVIYFRILGLGGVTFLLSSALSAFFAGRHDTVTLMLAHLAGGITNAVVDVVLIFGYLGMPRMGIAGAACGTVIGHVVQVAILASRFFLPQFRQTFHTWRGRAPDPALLCRMVRYGFPNGVRFFVEVGAWTAFLFIIGRIDNIGLAASNIVWRINGMTFFPIFGLSLVVSMLVGQAQGAGRPDLSRRVTRRGLLIGQVWMTGAAALMVLAPDLVLRVFFAGVQTPWQQEIHILAVKLLRFVAIYCMAHNTCLIIMAMLAGAGDTRWMMGMTLSLHLGFLAILSLLAYLGAGTMSLWLAATCFYYVTATIWLRRFLSGAWEGKRVVEHPPAEERAQDLLTGET